MAESRACHTIAAQQAQTYLSVLRQGVNILAQNLPGSINTCAAPFKRIVHAARSMHNVQHGGRQDRLFFSKGLVIRLGLLVLLSANRAIC